MSKSNISVGTQGWADRINAAWRKSALAYIETGLILIECKKTVAHGDWTDMLENGLDFDPNTAQRLMKIARDRRITNPANLPLLPKRWTELYQLTKCKTNDEFEHMLKHGYAIRAPKPTVTVAEYHDVTQSPGPQPGVAVSASGGSGIPPLSAPQSETPHDDREGGDSDVTLYTLSDVGLQGYYQDAEEVERFDHVWPADLDDSSVTTDRAEGETPQAVAPPFRADESIFGPPRDGMISIWIDPAHPMSVFATGLMMAVDGLQRMPVAVAAAQWPENMPLLTQTLHDFADLMIEFEAAYRAQHGNGNAAALGADAAQ